MPGEDQFIDIRPDEGGLTLHVRAWPGEKVPFVLVHGLSSNCRTWEGVAAWLAAAGHRVVAVDQRGHGLSAKPEQGYDFATITADLVRLMDALALDRPVVVGQSWGGNVVLELGARYPQRTRGLGMVDGGYIDLQNRPGATWEKISVQLRPPDLAGTPREQMRRRLRHVHPGWSDDGIEHTLANFEMLPDGTVRPWLTLDRHLQILRAMWEQRPPALYPRVSQPVLICSAADLRDPERMAVKREQVAAAERGLPHAVVHWFDNTDHDIHVHRPAALAALCVEAAQNGIWTDAPPV